MNAAAPILTLSAAMLLAFCVLAETTQQLCFKIGVARIPGAAGAVRGALGQPFVWAGIAIWVIEVLAWIWVLRGAPLTIAYPAMTLTYVCVPLGGVLLLREHLTRRQAAGAVLIAIGVLCVALSGGGG